MGGYDNWHLEDMHSGSAWVGGGLLLGLLLLGMLALVLLAGRPWARPDATWRQNADARVSRDDGTGPYAGHRATSLPAQRDGWKAGSRR